MKKIKLFTHTDLDGAGCAILGKIAYKDIDIEYCGIDNINEKVKNFLTENKNNIGDFKNCIYSFFYITDLSVNIEVANMIEEENNRSIKLDGQGICQLLDHHKTAEWLNEYMWAIVDTNERIKASGTSLFFDYLTDNNIINYENRTNLYLLEKTITKYDTWEWVNDELYGNNSKHLNDIFHFLGMNDFVEYYTQQCENIFYGVTAEHMVILSLLQLKNNEYIENKLKEVKIVEIENKRVAIIINDNKDVTSLLGDRILKTYKEVSYCCMIYSNGIAFRSKNHFDVSEIAKNLGGGGHKNAAGCKISDQSKIYIKKYFEIE